jgi:hypothetical protein
MLTELQDPSPPRARWRPRSYLDLTVDQLAGIAAFHAVRRAGAATVGGTTSREDRLDRARLAEVQERQQAALVARLEEQLRTSGDLLPHVVPCRAVLAHRDRWYTDRLTPRLEDLGIEVSVVLDNGADAVGAAVAEQPDLVLVQERLAMVPGEVVVEQVRHCCPRAVLVAHVDSDAKVAALLRAGADGVVTRRMPPQDVAVVLSDLLTAASPGR